MADLTIGARPGAASSWAFSLSALAAIFWGTNFEATRIALTDLPPWTAAAGRFAVATGAILIWLVARGALDIQVLRRNAVAFIGLGVIGVAGFNAALFIGMQTSSPVTGALIMATTPLTTTLLASLLDGHRPGARNLIGLVASLVGVALTVGGLAGAPLKSGDLFILAGSLAWALYTVGCRRWVRGATPVQTTAWTMLAGAAALIAGAFLVEMPLAAMRAAHLSVHLAVIYMGLVGSVLAYLFWQVGIAARGPAATSVLFNLVPVAALIVAIAFGRPPAISQLAGMAITIAGILFASGRLPSIQ